MRETEPRRGPSGGTAAHPGPPALAGVAGVGAGFLHLFVCFQSCESEVISGENFLTEKKLNKVTLGKI